MIKERKRRAVSPFIFNNHRVTKSSRAYETETLNTARTRAENDSLFTSENYKHVNLSISRDPTLLQRDKTSE